jgi:ubiquitin-activating enzyme E1 C
MDYLLTRESKYPGENFSPGEELKKNYPSLQILVVGAGGLGCEILKNLAVCGIKHIFVVDMDTIELSNLNRQFLFRQKDIGRFKAEVASEFIKRKYPDIEIKSSCKEIQCFSDEFFRRFHIIIGGLDSIEARSYLNKKVHDLVEFDEDGNPDPDTVIPFIDGGTEGFNGQVHSIIPYKTSCFECIAGIRNAKRNTYPLCTIESNPRVPEHCIAYAFTVEWKKHHDRSVDNDSIEDVEWIYKTALERANKFKIEGVTYNLTLGVIKNVIPAISSTNALIAASTVMEALKIWSGISKRLNNYFMYIGHEGLNTTTYAAEKEEDCKVCSKHVGILKVEESDTWKNVLTRIIGATHINSDQEFRIFHNNQYIYSVFKQNPDDTTLSKKSEVDENKTIKELVDSEDIIIHKLFEIMPTNDVNNVTKIKLKRPQDFEEEE